MELGHTEPSSSADDREVNAWSKSQHISQDEINDIAEDNPNQNQKFLNHATCVNSNSPHADHRDDGDTGVKGAGTNATDGGRSEVQTDNSHNGARHHGRHEFFDPSHAC